MYYCLTILFYLIRSVSSSPFRLLRSVSVSPLQRPLQVLLHLGFTEPATACCIACCNAHGDNH